MTSPKSGATLITLMRSLSCFSGIVSVTTRPSSAPLSMRSYAGPLSTACVQNALTLFAPCSLNAPAALTMVPAVSIISSIRITSLPATSPMIFITSLLFASSRRLSTMTRSSESFLAKLLARATPPTSGLAIIGFFKFFSFR